MNQIDAILKYIKRPLVHYTLSENLQNLLQNYHRTSLFKSLSMLPPTLVNFPLSFINSQGKQEKAFIEHVSFRYLPLSSEIPSPHYHTIQPQLNQTFENIFKKSASVNGLAAYIRGLDYDYSDEIFSQVHFISSDEEIPTNLPSQVILVILPGPRTPPPSQNIKNTLIRISSGLPFTPQAINEFLEIFMVDDQNKLDNPQFSSFLLQFQQKIAPIVLDKIQQSLLSTSKIANQRKLFSSANNDEFRLKTGSYLYLLNLQTQASDYFKLIQSSKYLVFALERLNRIKHCQFSQQLLLLAQDTGNLICRRITILMFIQSRDNEIYNNILSGQIMYSEYVNSIQNAHCYLIAYDYNKRFGIRNLSLLYNSVKIYFLQKMYENSYTLCNELIKRTIRISDNEHVKQSILTIQIGNSVGIDREKCLQFSRQIAGINAKAKSLSKNFNNKQLISKWIGKQMVEISEYRVIQNGISQNFEEIAFNQDFVMESQLEAIPCSRAVVIYRAMNTIRKIQQNIEIEEINPFLEINAYRNKNLYKNECNQLNLDNTLFNGCFCIDKNELVLNQAIYGKYQKVSQQYKIGDDIQILILVKYKAAYFDSIVSNSLLISENQKLQITQQMPLSINDNTILIFRFKLQENEHFTQLQLTLNGQQIIFTVDIKFILKSERISNLCLQLPKTIKTNHYYQGKLTLDKEEQTNILLTSNLNQHIQFDSTKYFQFDSPKNIDDVQKFLDVLSLENTDLQLIIQNKEFRQNALSTILLKKLQYNLLIQKQFKEDLNITQTTSNDINFTLQFSKPGAYVVSLYVYDGYHFAKIQQHIDVIEGTKNMTKLAGYKIVNKQLKFYIMRENQDKNSFIYSNYGNLDRIGKVSAQITLQRNMQQDQNIDSVFQYYKRILISKSLDQIICVVDDAIHQLDQITYIESSQVKEQQKLGKSLLEKDINGLNIIYSQYISSILAKQPIMFITLDEQKIWFNYSKMNLELISGCVYQVSEDIGKLNIELLNITDYQQTISVLIQPILGFVQGDLIFDIIVEKQSYICKVLDFYSTIKIFLNAQLVFE
ncbi:hypothetical protein SS50377_20353 [Spironucleus salmonicida]|uniref:Uncharacterized protein n=1 Tax=Spironucleus salmonicida TaxID=348837 RepID=V6LQK0_9EUKA|nr:hypothetical protein SS50377_20353 [Spironucleus salmonicida]|eukprot:EST43034.1 Hypothetical protein SS50377_17336 [Spironucleus salmonicida]